jgi:peptidyl-dipeptidase Dcp
MPLEPSNPFALPSTLPYELPPFAHITDDHYLPAFYAGMEEHLAEIEAIISSGEEASVANTVVAMESGGQLLNRVAAVFFNKSSSDTNERIQAIEEEIAPKLTAHEDAIQLNPALFSRIKDLYGRKDSLDLTEEDEWLLTRYYRDFVHAGAHLDESEREVLKGLNQDISRLSTRFAKALLADTNDLAVVVETAEELDGLSEAEIAACAAAASERGHEGKFLIPAVNFSGHPLLGSLRNRALREKLLKNSLIKGVRGNENDTRNLLVEIAALRSQRAQLFGVGTHADYVIGEQTAGSVENVHAMLRKIAPAAVSNARAEAEDLQAAVKTSGEDFEIQSWDWDFYTEIVRREKFSVDTSELRPYFELERVLKDGVFFAANKLFGLTFIERSDLVAYHPEARVFEVLQEDGSPLGLYVADFFTRDSKHGGAWMNSLVSQNFLHQQLPVVVNNLNVPKPPAGEPALLTFDMTTTLFHEFGHALHGLLSSVMYPRFSGTSVQRDFVEFPSQVNEMWILWPEVVENYARHYQTGEALPKEIIENIKNAAAFNEGYATTSYLSASILDLAWHSLPPEKRINAEEVEAFETEAIAEYGLEFAPVPVRYRSTYFSHIWAGGYSAGYYGYIWSEVLDADAVEWFKENGGLTRANGDHFRAELLGRGGSVDSMQMFRNFRGRDARIEPLLERRGLL